MASDLKRQKIKNKQTKEKNKFRNKIFDFTFFKYYVSGLHREHKVFYIKHNHFSQNVVTFNVNCNTSTA